MQRRHLLGLSGVVLAASLAGCIGGLRTNGSGGITRAEPAVDPNVSEEQLAELVGPTNTFALALFDALVDADPDENLFASPVSIAIALAMTYAGAQGVTRDEMREVLGFAQEDDEIHEAFNELQRSFESRGEDVETEPGGAYDEDDDPVPFELALANSVWGQEEYGFEEAYLDVLVDHYYGSLEEVNFVEQPEETRQRINDWVADNTEDRIDELLPEGSIDALVRLVLVNTIYFYANWLHPFEEGLTESDTFTAIDGTAHKVPLMQKQRQWPYAEVDGTQAVELPYVGEEASMIVLLPPEDDYRAFEADFDLDQLAQIQAALDRREGTVVLPRFEFESSVELREPLEALGMASAFDPGHADFSGMIEHEDDLYLDNVYHDAFVKVDEEGTEAAAATAAVMRTTSAPADPFTFRADRPFLFLIRDNPTGALIFVGRVVDPADWE